MGSNKLRRVAEIIYIVEEQREEFLKGALNPDQETQRIQWMCGVRKQQYFAINDLILMTFEYNGNDFNKDMAKMAEYLDQKGNLVKTRRKDVPLEERNKTNWWAPIKRLGSFLDTKPSFINEAEFQDYVKPDGSMIRSDKYNTSYDEEDWNDWKYM